jgi:hypothetical protein
MGLSDKLRDPDSNVGSRPFASKASCERKVKWTATKAWLEAKRLTARTGVLIKPYKCRHCDQWHVGKPWTGQGGRIKP